MDEPGPGPYSTVIDAEGNNYKTVAIGSQIYMAENLMATRFNDCSPISNVVDGLKWSNCEKPGDCWYDNYADSLKNIYGALYNWYTVSTGKLCPEG